MCSEHIFPLPLYLLLSLSLSSLCFEWIPTESIRLKFIWFLCILNDNKFRLFASHFHVSLSLIISNWNWSGLHECLNSHARARVDFLPQCKNIQIIVSHWDTKKVTHTAHIFYCTLFIYRAIRKNDGQQQQIHSLYETLWSLTLSWKFHKVIVCVRLWNVYEECRE